MGKGKNRINEKHHLLLYNCIKVDFYPILPNFTQFYPILPIFEKSVKEIPGTDDGGMRITLKYFTKLK